MKKIIYTIVLSTVIYTSGYYVWVASSPILFKDDSFLRGVADEGVNSTGPSFVDYDNDGDIDIYVSTEYHGTNQGNRLFENNGNGKFKDVAVERGVDNKTGLGRGASWGDYDNDGDMDMVVSNMPPSDRSIHIPTTLYKNLLIETGEANFEDVSREANLFRKAYPKDQEIGGIGNTGAGVAWADYDNDGDLDLYWKCAEYDIDNALFRNNGDGTFTDVTEESGTAILEMVTEGNSQGSPNWTDVNQDGLIDLLVTNEGDRKIMLLNQGDGTFENITPSFRTPSATAFLNPGNANGACIGDIDNDGDLDIIAMGVTDPGSFPGSAATLIYENSDGVFTELDHDMMDLCQGWTDWGDVDNDGDLDLLLMGVDHESSFHTIIYRNGHEISFASVTSPSGNGRSEMISSTHHKNIDLTFNGWADVWLDAEFTNWSIESSLPRIKVPQLIIQGNDDEYGTSAHVETIVNQSAGSVKTCYLENCGHSMLSEKPNAVLDALISIV